MLTTENNPNLDDHHIVWERKVVMDVLGIKADSTFYRAIKKDGLPKPIRIGGLAKWRKSEILEWLDSRPQGLEHEV